MIADKMKNKNIIVIEKENLIGKIKRATPQFLITAGAGDIDTLVKAISKILTAGNGSN